MLLFVNLEKFKISNITSQTSGAVYLTDAEALDVNRIFSSRLSYNKGSMVTHMLRWVMVTLISFKLFTKLPFR